jgi:type II secretory pathway pseudopilin PulG
MSGPAPPRVRRGYAVASLVLGILSIPTLGLLLVGAMASVILGVVALVKESRQPEEYGGKGMAITGIVLAGVSILILPVVAGIVAAIAIPNVLRKRVSGNEAAAIRDVRAVITAEAEYQKANAGYFDTLECLSAPETCIPGYHGPSVIDRRLLSMAAEDGYSRAFFPGPRAEPTPLGASTSSLMAFAYVAVPVSLGKTGTRSFCGDATGRICYTTRGVIVPELGVCPSDCKR